MIKSKQQIKKEELKYRAMDDARILAQYQEIMNDNDRRKRAIQEAQTQANDLQKRANAMKSVAKKGKK